MFPWDPALVRMKAKHAELIKKRDRFNEQIGFLEKRIADHPELVRRYLERQASDDPTVKRMARFEADPRK